MAVFATTYIPTGTLTGVMRNHLVDDLLTPRLMGFRQIHIEDEPASLMTDRLTWKVTFGNWLSAAPLTIRKNGAIMAASQIGTTYTTGTFTLGNTVGTTYTAVAPDVGADGRPRDVVEVCYVFDYFPAEVLQSFLISAMSVVNMTAVGPPTEYTIDDAPVNWEGVIVDLAYAMAIEKMMLDYDLWRYRLVYALGPNQVEDGSGDIVGQLQTLKQNAEERANLAMQNEKFKTGNYLAAPTSLYYEAVRGYGSGGVHGLPFVTGKLKGFRPNRYM